MKENYGKALPVPNENRQMYVTVESARNAAYEVVKKSSKCYRSELAQQREELYNEILEKYVQFAIPTNAEMKTLLLTNHLRVKHGKMEYETYNLHREIKPLNEPIEIPLALLLALHEMDNRAVRLKEREEHMSGHLFAELMYMRDKEHIESCLPEIMPYLKFEPFVYDTDFWKDVLSGMNKEE